MPNDGATAWIAATWPWPPAMAGSRRTATRATPGAISLSSSSHFPLMPYSNWTNPVALPPGRAKLSTKPAPTGSGTSTNTTGTVRVACNNGPTPAAPVVSMTSGVSATSSAAYLRMRSASPAAQRCSICRFWPTAQPSCASVCAKAVLRTCASGSSEARFVSTPMRRMRSRCCARVGSGHAAAAPPSSVMTARRFTRSPRRRGRAASRLINSDWFKEHATELLATTTLTETLKPLSGLIASELEPSEFLRDNALLRTMDLCELGAYLQNWRTACGRDRSVPALLQERLGITKG
jgi:hypothetical protein